jgi:HEPN domain-containing protein
MPPEEAQQEARGWFRKAESDLRTIDLVMPAEDPPLDTVCFHAQQAAEKYLKGLLTFLGAPFPKSHDLEELLALLPADRPLALDLPALAELSHLAVAPRYPGWDEPVERETAERAIATARSVKAAVLVALARDGFAP